MTEERPPHIDPAKWEAACAISNELLPLVQRLAHKHGPGMAVAGCMTASATVAANHGIPADAYHASVLHMLRSMLRPVPSNSEGVH